MRRLRSFLLAMIVALVFSIWPHGCGDEEDQACDKSKKECTDRGGTPLDCESSGNCLIAECTCQCRIE